MLPWICLVLVITALVIESRRVERDRRRVPVRIHVHGTRGKSSTVRALARLLRERGLSVLAKTTGDAPEYILPDGQIEPIRRIGPPRIHEHVTVLRRAAALGVDAVVVEGMALGPETVWHSEAILRATHAVVTNTRPDHAETMGPGRAGVQMTLSYMIPPRGELFLGDEEGTEDLAAFAVTCGCRTMIVEGPTSERQAERLASAVAERIAPNPIAFPPFELCDAATRRDFDLVHDGMTVRFRDLFSANDAETSAALWSENRPDRQRLQVALLATRADRPLRTRDLLVRLLVDERFDLIVPQGDHAGYVWLAAAGDRRLSRVPPWGRPVDVTTRLCRAAAARGLCGVEITGIGNCHGIGERWRDLVKGSRDRAR